MQQTITWANVSQCSMLPYGITRPQWDFSVPDGDWVTDRSTKLCFTRTGIPIAQTPWLSNFYNGTSLAANTYINSSPPGQNGNHFAGDILRWIFAHERFYIFINISLKFVPKGLIHNNPALVQIMAWRRIGDKPLAETMLTQFTDAYMRH